MIRTRFADLETPKLLLSEPVFERNLARMRDRAAALGVALRPHMKTAKSIMAAQRVGAERITVSTLKEAEYFAAAGFKDILYAIGIAPGKLAHAASIRRRGVDLTLILDSPEAATAATAAARDLDQSLPFLIEIDSDGHRAGVRPDDPMLIEIAARLDPTWSPLRGVMTHAGGSYDCRTHAALIAMAEQERQAAVRSAERLRDAGHPAPVVSVGSTPTALSARELNGVTELRAGVYMMFDLVMAGLGVCTLEDIALSVLTTVIGHQTSKNWIIVDAGWMALSRDHGTAAQDLDQGYGLVCTEDGEVLHDLIVVSANQEHGVIARRDGGPLGPDAYPLGARLRILPNHACATAAQHDAYQLLDAHGEIRAVWPRMNGW